MGTFELPGPGIGPFEIKFAGLFGFAFVLTPSGFLEYERRIPPLIELESGFPCNSLRALVAA